MATWMSMGFQDSNSMYMDNLISFHNLNMMVIVGIITLVLFILMDLSTNKYCNRFLLKNHTIEIIWTIIPIFILLYICFPSLKILYYIDDVFNPYFTVKAIGHQWYWSYEYPDFCDFYYDSYMVADLNELSQFRLLDVDHRVVIPMKIPVRLVTTSEDVIHAWAIPSLGIKLDSVPGRVNQGNLFAIRPGVHFGQCSEICGANHSFMPISVESTSVRGFMFWIYFMLKYTMPVFY